MSAAQMSATMQAHIKKCIINSASKHTGGVEFEKYLSSAKIRQDTDPAHKGHISTISKDGLRFLVKDLEQVLLLPTVQKNGKPIKLTKANIRDYYISDATARTLSKIDYTEFVNSVADISRPGSTNMIGPPLADDEAQKPTAVVLKRGIIPTSVKDLTLVTGLNYKELVKEFIQYIETFSYVSPDHKVISDESLKLNVSRNIEKQLNAGHLLGVFNKRVEGILGEALTPPSNATKDEQDISYKFNSILDILGQIDYLTSNLAYDFDAYLETTKILKQNGIILATELQYSLTNGIIGNALTEAGKALNSLVSTTRDNSDLDSAYKRLVVSLNKAVDIAIATGNDLLKYNPENFPDAHKHIKDALSSMTFAKSFIQTEGSPNIEDYIAEITAAILNGKVPKQYLTTVSNKFHLHTRNSDVKARKAEKVQKIKIAVNKLKVHTTKVSKGIKGQQIRNKRGQFYSLANLQVLLNTKLEQTIAGNMGDEPFPGGQRKILNYDTGRFASTVAVERLSQSRQGAITAFYSYMKYPYQTFAPGFKQGSPKSRDPRLLISKSIHEIAATMVGNKLRAVSI